MKQIFSLVVLTLMFCSVLAITWEETPHQIGDAALSFAGEYATQAVGDTIYIAYLSRVDDDSSRLNFTKSSAGNSYTIQVMDHLEFPITADPGAPSLVLDLPNIAIKVKGEKYLYHCHSEDYGISWACQMLDEGPVKSNDPYPLMSLTEEGIENFTVKSQANDPGMIFVNNNQSMNDTNVYYTGKDFVDGPVLINADLYIRQAGGGSNGGWPTFTELVTIAGEVISIPPTFPVDQVFQGGLIENADPELFSTNHYLFSDIYRGLAMHFGFGGPNHIYLMEAEGTSFTLRHGVITQPYTVNVDVFDPYPSVGSSPLFSNSFTTVDTVWAGLGAGQLSNRSFFINGTLWLKGTFTGQVTIGCSSDIYLIGDILLSGTQPPESPRQNSRDKVCLVSEGQIIIKYGYKNPADSTRIHPNLGSDSEYPDTAGGGIFIYADLFALGENPQNPRRDGMLTFEYQHPHPSVPAVNMNFGGQSHYFDKIDLHRRHYPQTAEHPWPANIDYPWYNPLWPEKAPYLERGTVNLWGSLYQERVGYLHRSYNDLEYPNASGIWDIDLDLCGGPVSPNPVNEAVIPDMTLSPVNYPGAAGSGVGYKKVHHHDPRIFRSMLRNDVWGLGAFITKSIGFDSPYTIARRYTLNEPVIHKSMDHLGRWFLYHLNNNLFWNYGEYPQNLPEGWEIVQAKLLPNGDVLSLQKSTGDEGQSCRLVISDLEQYHTSIIHESSYTQSYISLHRIWDGFLFVIPGATNNAAKLIRLDENGTIVSSDYTLPLTADFGSTPLYDSKIALSTPAPGILHACLWAKGSSEGAQFWHLQGSIYPVSVDDSVIEAPVQSLRCYPNPFTDRISLEVKSPTNQGLQIQIYNVKGQKVKTLQLSTQSGSGQITWNGNDDKGQPVAQGVYFARIADAEHTKITKILKIK